MCKGGFSDGAHTECLEDSIVPDSEESYLSNLAQKAADAAPDGTTRDAFLMFFAWGMALVIIGAVIIICVSMITRQPIPFVQWNFKGGGTAGGADAAGVSMQVISDRAARIAPSAVYAYGYGDHYLGLTDAYALLQRAGQFWRFTPEQTDATRGSGKREHAGTCEKIFTGNNGCPAGKRRQCPAGAKSYRRIQAPLIRAGSLLNRSKLRQRESGALAYDCGAPAICEVVCGACELTLK